MPAAKLRRPAAWHEQDKHEEEDDADEEPLVSIAATRGKGKNTLKDDEDAEDGAADSRTTTRAQRHTFAKNRHLFDQALVAQFDKLMDTANKTVGKQAQINQIINSCVTRKAAGGVGVLIKTRSVKRFQRSMMRDENKETAHGLGWWSLVGTKFGGSESLAQKALDAGEVYQAEDTGLYYQKSHTIERTRVQEKGYKGEEDTGGLLSSDEFVQALCDQEEQLTAEPLGDWFKQCQKGVPKKIAGAQADDGDFTVMQESFDAVSRVTLALRRLGTKMMAAGGNSETTKLMSGRAISLCKAVAGPSEAIESLLVAQGEAKRNISKADVAEALKAMSVPYKQMVELFNEIVIQVKSAAKGSKTADAAKGLKPIKL
ncbi:unnamed protein product [Prorocentrum cordatum]|uniref:Uncharacterized protein n=2 Tax=Prorocentrum cordatum TaxID=2364126 RepID=A0ABN9PSH8_9DINO|nr:unnamed protein product [Polarella glacialis]